MTSPGPPQRRSAEIRTCGRVRPPLIIPEGQGSSVPDYRKINHFEAIFELSDIGARFNQFTQLPPQEMLARTSAVLPPWISVLLVVAIAWQLANIVWLLVPSDVDTVTTAPSAQDRATLAESAGGADIQAIVNAHLFGDYNAVETVVEAEPVDAPDTNLSLELRGTIVADVPEEALAIIAEKGGDEHVYAIGDGWRPSGCRGPTKARAVAGPPRADDRSPRRVQHPRCASWSTVIRPESPTSFARSRSFAMASSRATGCTRGESDSSSPHWG